MDRLGKLSRLASSAKSAVKYGEEYASSSREKALSMVPEEQRKKLKEKWSREDEAEAAEAKRMKDEKDREKAAKKREFERLQQKSKLVAKLVKDEPLSRGETRALEGVESARRGLTDEEKEVIEEQKRSLTELLDTYKKDPKGNKQKIEMLESQIRELTNPKGRGRRTRKRRHAKRRTTRRR
jgi:hypothetical protein